MSAPDNSELLAAAQNVVAHLGFGVLSVGAVRALRDACDRVIEADEADTKRIASEWLDAIYATPKSEATPC